MTSLNVRLVFSLLLCKFAQIYLRRLIFPFIRCPQRPISCLSFCSFSFDGLFSDKTIMGSSSLSFHAARFPRGGVAAALKLLEWASTVIDGDKPTKDGIDLPRRRSTAEKGYKWSPWADELSSLSRPPAPSAFRHLQKPLISYDSTDSRRSHLPAWLNLRASNAIELLISDANRFNGTELAGSSS